MRYGHETGDGGPNLLISDLPPIQERFFNRELSWLAFNRRVLAEAVNADYPLLERLRFLSISGSNLDEFMMVRVAGIAAQVRRQIDELSIDGQTPQQQFGALLEAVKGLIDSQQDVLAGLKDDLAEAGIRIIDNDALTKVEAEWLRDYFEEHVVPVLTPQAIDPAHPFPFIANQGSGILFQLQRSVDGAAVTEMILIPPALPRFVRL
ncbi:MAG: RNA degradosome polyphosphate kinase, partial [Novosphingobium sp.]